MSRSLIVKGKPIPLMPDPMETFGEGDPFQWGDARSTAESTCWIDRVERIAGEHMFEVRDHQFLVLLLVMQANRNDGRQRCQLPLIDLHEQLQDMLIELPAVLLGT